MESNIILGRVTRCSTRGFAGAYPLQGKVIPSFGAFCAAPYQGGGEVIGTIYDINIEDDPLARQLASLDEVPKEQILDSQKNRQIPVEFSVLSLGYHDDGRMYQTLPPRPPLTLEPIRLLPGSELIAFTENYRFLHSIAQAPSLPIDDLLIACVIEASKARPESNRKRYMIGAGRMLARILARDLHRLEQILSSLSISMPGTPPG
jgi:hypothetical protein